MKEINNSSPKRKTCRVISGRYTDLVWTDKFSLAEALKLFAQLGLLDRHERTIIEWIESMWQSRLHIFPSLYNVLKARSSFCWQRRYRTFNTELRKKTKGQGSTLSKSASCHSYLAHLFEVRRQASLLERCN